MKQNRLDTYSLLPIEDFIDGDPYPGRGIICGNTPKPDVSAVAYFIMGRSDNSRNRVFEQEDDAVVIKPFDPSKVEDPTLIVYYPIRVYENSLIVTNGDQTDTIYDFLKNGGSFETALSTREFEPDPPNYTPRISALMDLETGDYKMSILKSGDKDGKTVSRYYFDYMALPGEGRFIHTYETDGSPIPTYLGEPERVTIPEDIDLFTKEIWDHLDPDNKISLCVRFVNRSTGDMEQRIINKFVKEGA
jgi:IMP cyclohydrolase